MRSELRTTGPLERALDIHVDAGDVTAFIDRMVDAFRRRHTFPGFRPGKVPAELILKRFHQDIDQAVLEELVPNSIQEAMQEHRVRPAVPGRISDLRYERGEPLTFTFTVEVWPEVQVGDYEGIEVDQLIEEVDEREVEQQIEWLRERLAEVAPVERPAEAGDVVSAELEAVDEAGERLPGTEKEATQMEAGAANLLPEFREASLGISAGESREIQVTYPDDFNNAELRGQTRRYRMTATQIAEKKLPPLDEEFTEKLEPGLGVDGLRAKIRLRLESEKRMASQERLEHAIVDRLIRDNQFDLPEGAIKSALERLEKRMREEDREVKPEELEKTYRPYIERSHRRDIVLAKVGEREDISVTRQEVEAEIGRIAGQEKRSIEEVEKDIGDLNRFQDFLFERRVLERLRSKVKVRAVNVPSAAATGGAPGAGAGAGAEAVSAGVAAAASEEPAAKDED